MKRECVIPVQKVSDIMEEENEAILFALIIGAVILGIGLAMFFNTPYRGYGAVVLAIGLMTVAMILTMRAEEIIHLKIYPTTTQSKTTARVSVETSAENETVSSAKTNQEVSEYEEPYEFQDEQAPDVLEVEDTEPFTPDMYETEQEEEQKLENEPELSVEAASPSS